MTAQPLPDMSQHPRSKSPTGVDVTRRVVVALMPAEREAFDLLARREARTGSSMARVLLLKAIESDPEARELLERCRLATATA